MRIRRSISVLTAFLAANLGLAQSSGNFESLMNAFIAVIAKDAVGLKAEARVLKQGEAVPAGFQVGRSSVAGEFVFRPKTWHELEKGEQDVLLRHPKLKAFLVSVRNDRIYPVLSSAAVDTGPAGWSPVQGAAPSTPEYMVVLDPHEMLRNRTTTIPVYPTAKK